MLNNTLPECIFSNMVSEETHDDFVDMNDNSKGKCQKMPITGENASSNGTIRDINRPSTVCSAPSSTKIHAVTAEIQQTITLCYNKKANSFVENKYKCTINSERLMQLKKIVDAAVRDHKVFTIKGLYGTIFLKRKTYKTLNDSKKVSLYLYSFGLIFKN